MSFAPVIIAATSRYFATGKTMENEGENKAPTQAECPVCEKSFKPEVIEVHVNRCIFLNTTEEHDRTRENKRSFGASFNANRSPANDSKKFRKTTQQISSPSASKKMTNFGNTNQSSTMTSSLENTLKKDKSHEDKDNPSTSNISTFDEIPAKKVENKQSVPLAERMRPETIEDYIGQSHVMGQNAILRKILDKNETPSMILWGPPGVGKTTLASIIANRCKAAQSARFVKLSAVSVGVNEVKQAVEIAKNEQKFGRKTILFMDEIHRFNKLQQDIFLPHVESGTITLIGATTENPSFSLNSALLSRCRVIVLEKLSIENVFEILRRSLREFEAIILDNNNENPSIKDLSFLPKIAVEESSLKWLSEISDGDARIALNSLQLAMESIDSKCDKISDLKLLTLDSIRDGIKRSHMLYDRKGDQHYDMISALHKSIRASDDSAALYWCTRMMIGGEDPRYICRRLVRMASEDVGLADPQALGIAMSGYDAVQQIGMPEADCIIAQVAVYLARAPKSREVHDALGACRREIKEWKGPLPSVPIELRNAPTKLMKDLGFGRNYNLAHKNDSGLTYMPEGMEDRAYF